MWKLLFEHLAKPTIAKLLGGLSISTAAVTALAYTFLLDQVQKLTPTQVLLTISALLTLSLLLGALVLYLLPSFKYLPKYQFFQHRVNGLYYCPPCRATKPLPRSRKKSQVGAARFAKASTKTLITWNLNRLRRKNMSAYSPNMAVKRDAQQLRCLRAPYLLR